MGNGRGVGVGRRVARYCRMHTARRAECLLSCPAPASRFVHDQTSSLLALPIRLMSALPSQISPGLAPFQNPRLWFAFYMSSSPDAQPPYQPLPTLQPNAYSPNPYAPLSGSTRITTTTSFLPTRIIFWTDRIRLLESSERRTIPSIPSYSNWICISRVSTFVKQPQ